jgi:hypothetical protein
VWYLAASASQRSANDPAPDRRRQARGSEGAGVPPAAAEAAQGLDRPEGAADSVCSRPMRLRRPEVPGPCLRPMRQEGGSVKSERKRWRAVKQALREQGRLDHPTRQYVRWDCPTAFARHDGKVIDVPRDRRVVMFPVVERKIHFDPNAKFVPIKQVRIDLVEHGTRTILTPANRRKLARQGRRWPRRVPHEFDWRVRAGGPWEPWELEAIIKEAPWFEEVRAL